MHYSPNYYDSVTVVDEISKETCILSSQEAKVTVLTNYTHYYIYKM